MRLIFILILIIGCSSSKAPVYTPKTGSEDYFEKEPEPKSEPEPSSSANRPVFESLPKVVITDELEKPKKENNRVVHKTIGLGRLSGYGSLNDLNINKASAHGTISLVDDLLKKLEFANLAFNPPQSMEVEERKVVELLVSTKEKEKLKLTGDVIFASNVKVSPKMKATLTGSGFSIQSLTPEEQLVDSKSITRWSWEIVAVKSGVQGLHLSLSALVKYQDDETTFVVRTFDKTVKVRVTTSQHITEFIKKYWQWLWALLVPTLYAWVSGRWKRAKEEKKTQV